MRSAGKFILSIGVAVFLFLTTANAFLHNHKADPFTHYDCPAYLVSVTLVSLTIFTAILIKLIFPRPSNIPVPKRENFLTSNYHNEYKNKAPPF